MAILIVGFSAALAALLHLRPGGAKVGNALPIALLASETALAGGAVAAAAILCLVFREPLTGFGFGRAGSRRGRDLGLGLVTGFGLLTALLAGIWALGGFSFGQIVDTPAQLVRFGLFYALLFALVAVAEEFMVRGYALVQLSRALSFWPAAILLSILFGAMHMSNAAETLTGLISAGVIGFVFAYSFYRSGSLMWALGFHAGWNYGQSFVWGVPDSGIALPGALFASRFHGPDWLTGGAVGPEASWLIAPVIVLAAAAAHLMLRDGASSRGRAR
jgi:hypothetical protein